MQLDRYASEGLDPNAIGQLCQAAASCIRRKMIVGVGDVAQGAASFNCSRAVSGVGPEFDRRCDPRRSTRRRSSTRAVSKADSGSVAPRWLQDFLLGSPRQGSVGGRSLVLPPPSPKLHGAFERAHRTHTRSSRDHRCRADRGCPSESSFRAASTPTTSFVRTSAGLPSTGRVLVSVGIKV